MDGWLSLIIGCWWQILWKICTKLSPTRFPPSTSATFMTSTSLSWHFHSPGSHQSSLLNSSESVSDEESWWSDSGLTKGVVSFQDPTSLSTVWEWLSIPLSVCFSWRLEIHLLILQNKHYVGNQSFITLPARGSNQKNSQTLRNLDFELHNK